MRPIVGATKIEPMKLRLTKRLVWVKVWVKEGVLYSARSLRGFQALKSRLVAGFSGTGLAYFW